MKNKFCLLHFISQKPYILWLAFMVHLCEMMISLDIFSIFYFIYLFIYFFWFFHFWFFELFGGLVKGQNMVQNETKLCLSCSISQESYITWFSLKVLMCKMIISPGVCFIFSKRWFSGLLDGKRAKNSPKWQKILYAALDISRTIHHMVVICGTQV